MYLDFVEILVRFAEIWLYFAGVFAQTRRIFRFLPEDIPAFAHFFSVRRVL